MNLPELQRHIMAKNPQDLYVFLGDEFVIQKIYINKIAEVSGLEVEYVGEYKDIIKALAGKSLFGTKKLYVIIDDTDILKQESAWQDINPNGNKIIFKYNTLDKRGKFYKQFEPQVVEFEQLSNEVLIKYIQKDMPNLLEVNCEKLIYMCGNSYNQILLELDKIKNYKLAHPDYVEDVCFLKLDQCRGIS